MGPAKLFPQVRGSG